MGIRFLCPAGHKLHVKSFLAGKRGICPHCGAKVRIPLESTVGQEQEPARDHPAESKGDFAEVESLLGSTSVVAAPGSPATATVAPTVEDPIADAPGATWYVRAASGEQYGPADAGRMQRWLEESRVDRDMYVWRDDWPAWRPAAEVFSSQYLGEVPPVRESDRPVAEPEKMAPEPVAPVAAEPNSTLARLRGRRAQGLWALALLIAAVFALIPAVVIVLLNQ